MNFIGGLSSDNSPKRVDTAATSALHHAPNSSAAAMCMMKEIEPLAATRSRVLRLSRRVATKMKVAKGHQPGNGSRSRHTTTPITRDAAATPATNRRMRTSRDIGRGWESRSDLLLITARSCPRTAKQAKQRDADLCDQADLQHERHPPKEKTAMGSGKPRYGPPDAPLISCPLVSAGPSLHLDRDPRTFVLSI